MLDLNRSDLCGWYGTVQRICRRVGHDRCMRQLGEGVMSTHPLMGVLAALLLAGKGCVGVKTTVALAGVSELIRTYHLSSQHLNHLHILTYARNHYTTLNSIYKPPLVAALQVARCHGFFFLFSCDSGYRTPCSTIYAIYTI